jgi:hypothetical protein
LGVLRDHGWINPDGNTTAQVFHLVREPMP